jgi:hypothetical protein
MVFTKKATETPKEETPQALETEECVYDVMKQIDMVCEALRRYCPEHAPMAAVEDEDDICDEDVALITNRMKASAEAERETGAQVNTAVNLEALENITVWDNMFE